MNFKKSYEVIYPEGFNKVEGYMNIAGAFHREKDVLCFIKGNNKLFLYN